ncbi:MAG TPA: hypothetical protein VHM70_15915 [Polyangiaceae bacterium]|jgi:hypothetical protein|nr:hypothetical protein [Polyangiaceae bacterium]
MSRSRSKSLAGRLPLLGLLLLGGCSASNGTGELVVLLEAEDTITHGLNAGQDIADIHDGWDVRYEAFLLDVGEIELHPTSDPEQRVRARQSYVVDLTKIPADGSALWHLADLEPGRFSFGYRTGGSLAHARRDASVSDADFAAFRAEKLTYAIEGRIENPKGVSCPPASSARDRGELPARALAPAGVQTAANTCFENPVIRFSLRARAPMGFGPCELDGTPGVSVPQGGSNTVAITIHGDHLFFNGFPTGDEGGIVRLAQWLADCDLNLDGEVSKSELQATAIADLPAIDDRYQLGGAPRNITSVWDLVLGQLQTQGHMDGEGDCELNP